VRQKNIEQRHTVPAVTFPQKISYGNHSFLIRTLPSVKEFHLFGKTKQDKRKDFDEAENKRLQKASVLFADYTAGMEFHQTSKNYMQNIKRLLIF
jgi:hypothetical protein